MSPEDSLYKKLMIRGSKERLPEGWGRSEVGGQVFVTKPKNKAISADLPGPNLMEESKEDFSRQAQEGQDNYSLISGMMNPDSQGFIDGYHKDDLSEQFSELEANEDLDSLLSEIEREKGINDPERAEANRFLEYSIRYGRGK